MSAKSKKTSAKKPASSKGPKYVYTWGAGKADGHGGMKNLLGGKGANLAEMTRINLPVPPGFTITTDVCTYFYANKRTYPAALQSQMEAGVANMEKIMGTKFGATTGTPLLVAVRSGAREERGAGGWTPSSTSASTTSPSSPSSTPPATSASRGIVTAVSSRCLATS